ncbi:MAG TPA: DHHA1 domain-containing protein [Anaerolineae bacterium]|nr:DHHA1 domain-containing protein [Anaerolineae bacterium]
MTDRLYYADPYRTRFTAQVIERLEVEGKPAVVLDRTAFYPEGGGQPSDRGRLNEADVVAVITREDGSQAVLHLLAAPILGDTLNGTIDWSRRFDLMQQHTGQHILSQAFIRVLGAETVAFHLSADPREGTVTIDLNRTGLPAAQVDEVEDLANQIVTENRPVTAHFVSHDELASIPLRRPPPVDRSIRIVEIADFDWSACGGTHVARSGEVGQIKIIKLDRRGPETRVEFRCGQRALTDYRRKNELISRVAADLSIGFWELDQAATRLVAENKALRKQLDEADARVAEFELREVLSDVRRCEDYAVAVRAWPARELATLRQLAKHIIARPKTIAVLGAAGEKPALVFARSADLPFDMSALVRNAAARLNGKGGGSPDFAQAGSPAASVEQIQAALEWAYSQLGS